ncbi:hypothetical protein [Hymenobacter cellulosilyticus]|uniref:Uncharacterized protein n=1 Tax=Hymenobacter cellulosilyticus TaxID=2932248 RepID=A0A8T9Q1P1_9BACT|nr:hypothetical protein [Hymenobacter cellulosilyticus]UOQ71666.1 hypothetical protein MUN79_24150 [Hymenobacter cellulosilyticus]
MKTVFRLGMLVLSGLGSHLAQAQTSRDPEDISQGQLLVQQSNGQALSAPEANPLTNQALLQQNGSLNQSSIDQHMLGVGRGNTASITQSGANNAAAILQSGAANRTSITQVGASNVAASEITGYNTESEIVQRGNGNRVDQRLSVDERRYSVEQMGNNNNLVQRESGSTAPGYEVTMKGNGIRIIIEQGRATTMP